MSLSLSLKPRVLRTYDSDAAAYILAVESADGESLESGVKDAITEFVVGCKIRGIWDAIKSCCLLCGARTIAGATVPLKGIPPTLTGFVGDYNRETGLKRVSGSGILLNRKTNTDPQNNKHVAVYPTSIDYGSADNVFRTLLAGGSNSGNTFIVVNSLGLGLRANTALSIVSNQPVNAGLIGVSILDSSRSQLLYNNRINVLNINTVTPVDLELYLFTGAGLSASTSRIAFYSIGERLDLRLLDQCVSSLRQNFLRSISTYSVIDADALNYIRRVESADGFVLENSVKQAIDNLVIGLKADGLWPSIKACCIMSGPKTVAGALTPLVGPSPQNFNFTENHYIRSSGLIGINNGVRYLDSKRPNNADSQNNHHMCVYKTSGTDLNWFIASSNTGIGARGQVSYGLMTASRISSGWVEVADNLYNWGSMGLIGIARNNSNNYNVIGNNFTATVSSASVAPSSDNVSVFARMGGGINSNTGYRFSYYSIGEYLNLSLLDARLDTFMAALSNSGT